MRCGMTKNGWHVENILLQKRFVSLLFVLVFLFVLFLQAIELLQCLVQNLVHS